MRLYLTFFIVFSLIQLIICDEDDVPSSLPPHILKIIEQVEDLLPESDPPEELSKDPPKCVNFLFNSNIFLPRT